MPVERGSILKALEEARRNSSRRNFSQSIDLIINLQDFDVKKPENRLNEVIELPHPPKPGVKVAVFATGDLAVRAKNAGADRVLGREELEAMASNRREAKRLANATDFFLAETTLMATVGKVLGPILGPHGKMPTPVPPNAPVESIIERHRRSVKIRVRDQPNVQCSIGVESMTDAEIADNIHTVISRVEARLPKGLKNIREVGVKTTMGPFTKVVFQN